MTENELLNNALYRCATIHQPHALKAFLAAQNLSVIFNNMPPEKMNIWQQTAFLISQSEMQVEGHFSQKVQAPEFSEFRIAKVLNQGIYPAAYQAVYQWHQTKGFSNIFGFYLNLAANNDEYLSHNVTILLAFKHLYTQLDEAQIAPFLDRLTEFITASFHDKSSSAALECQSAYGFDAVLSVCLEQPSFFGHNLITLVWIMRSKAYLSERFLACLTHNLYQQATRPLEDPDDVVNQALFTLSKPCDNGTFFYQKLKSMVFDSCNNLHQVTLADALYYLYQQFPQESARISRMADYYVRVFKG